MIIAKEKTIAYTRIGLDLYIYVSAKDKLPSDKDFDQYLEFLFQSFKPGRQPRCIVHERFHGVTAGQRKLMRDVIEPYSPVVAVITASALSRGIVTALSWFKKDFKAFLPEERLAACEHVGLSADKATEVWKVIQALERKLD